MRAAIGETDRRRAIQLAYNEEHGITPETIVKGISDIAGVPAVRRQGPDQRRRAPRKRQGRAWRRPRSRSTIVELEEEMLAAADDLRFEYAARLRDEIRDLRRELDAGDYSVSKAGTSPPPPRSSDLRAASLRNCCELQMRRQRAWRCGHRRSSATGARATRTQVTPGDGDVEAAEDELAHRVDRVGQRVEAVQDRQPGGQRRRPGTARRR